MELQTIRQKLQTLKASPPETVATPWSPSRLTAPSPDLAQVTTAIETLRQRSGQPLSPPVTSLQQFDAALSALEQLAQQQQQALQRLRTVGISLIQQTQPGTSPDVDDIARFLTECQDIQIPTIQRDAAGYLDLDYHTVNFHQADQGVTTKGGMRSQLFQHSAGNLQSSNNPTAIPNRSKFNTTATGLVTDLKRFYQVVHRVFQRWQRHYSASAQRSRSSQFTLLDSAIWFIGAAIARIVLNQLFLLYPALWTPVAFLLIGGILITLYRAILSPQPNPVSGYRTLMIILGLVIGGRFS
ncbi:hypothetical protein [Leptolyngbya sp. Heron Island J]|uniref:hypothetical protein n=1 Tax=Leptolyngbya sp. Heron Island J TaxID=1385935 RepID=UPI00040E7B9A|nr:hypothetical protein [Leptolyngbya sp. Heron Island J]